MKMGPPTRPSPQIAPQFAHDYLERKIFRIVVNLYHDWPVANLTGSRLRLCGACFGTLRLGGGAAARRWYDLDRFLNLGGAIGVCSASGVEDKHIACYDLGFVTRLAVLLPRAVLQPTLYINQAALGQVLAAYLRQLIPDDHAMPIGLLLH